MPMRRPIARLSGRGRRSCVEPSRRFDGLDQHHDHRRSAQGDHIPTGEIRQAADDAAIVFR